MVIHHNKANDETREYARGFVVIGLLSVVLE